jgi:hypothetical protein
VACHSADMVPPAGLTNSSMAPPAKQRPNFEVELQAIEDYRRFAAVTIQRYYRGWIVRLHRARKVCTQTTCQTALDTRMQRCSALCIVHVASHMQLIQPLLLCMASEYLLVPPLDQLAGSSTAGARTVRSGTPSRCSTPVHSSSSDPGQLEELQEQTNLSLL